MELLQQDVKAQSLLSPRRPKAEVAGAEGPAAVPPSSRDNTAALLVAALADTAWAELDRAEIAGRGAGANPTTTSAPANSTVDLDTGVEIMGLSYNAEGDLQAFLSTLLTSSITCAALVAVFTVLRVRWPQKYSANVLDGTAPSSPDVTRLFSWIEASMSVNTHQVAESSGLDQAMLLEFANFAMKICLVVGGPIVCVTCPLNWIFGGHFSGRDRMSYVSLGNVRPGSELYWVTAAAVWFTVLATVHLIFQAQERYMALRWRWCRQMPHNQANTVLVEGIPERFQSDAELMKFFKVLFPGDRIQSTYVVKDTTALCRLNEQLAEAQHSLAVAKAYRDESPDSPPQVRQRFCGTLADAVGHWESVVKELKPQSKTLRDAINEDCNTGTVGGHFCGSGFVTFHERSDAELAVRLTNVSSDSLEWRIDHPPEPGDVLWVDLMQDPTAEMGRHLIGYGLVAGLYFAYMPLVIGITNLAKIINLGPFLQPFWAGIAPTLGLTLMVSFLPTFLIAIFKLFFTLRAEAWAQLRLQEWYFWFNMVFVVMATAVAQNTRDFTRTIAESPFEIFPMLANTMPYASHFYLNYILMQWSTHCLNLLRYVNLSKFMFLSKIYDESEAAKMSEPEDQDYYGIGSRSARWTTVLVIGLVYGTICPPMFLLVFLNFALVRVVMGYLIPFAETRKADLGGVFWTTQLRHLSHGLILYCILMIGLLSTRAPHIITTVVTVPAIGYVYAALLRFNSHFSVKNLPFHELMSDEGKAKSAALGKRTLKDQYIQKELVETSA